MILFHTSLSLLPFTHTSFTSIFIRLLSPFPSPHAPLTSTSVTQSHNAQTAQEGSREGIEKYMKDLSQMMDGMLDLNRRNQLPDRERAICLKLLLRVTLKVLNRLYYSYYSSIFMLFDLFHDTRQTP